MDDLGEGAGIFAEGCPYVRWNSVAFPLLMVVGTDDQYVFNGIPYLTDRAHDPEGSMTSHVIRESCHSDSQTGNNPLIHLGDGIFPSFGSVFYFSKWEGAVGPFQGPFSIDFVLYIAFDVRGRRVGVWNPAMPTIIR